MRHHQVAQYRADAAELRPPQRIGFHGPLGCRQELPARIDQSLGGGDEHVPTLAMDAFHVGQELLGGKRTLRQIDQVRRLTLPLAGQRRGGRHPPSVAAHRLDDLHGIGCADGFSVQPRLPDRDPQPACHARMSRAVISFDKVIVDRFRNRDRVQVVAQVRGQTMQPQRRRRRAVASNVEEVPDLARLEGAHDSFHVVIAEVHARRAQRRRRGAAQVLQYFARHAAQVDQVFP